MASKRPADPSADKLIRDEPRHYHTADGRFQVQAEAAGAWYLSDGESVNEFGLPRLVGPFGTLDDVRAAVAAARGQLTGDPPDAAAGRPASRLLTSEPPHEADKKG